MIWVFGANQFLVLVLWHPPDCIGKVVLLVGEQGFIPTIS
jgi:hypothetical protein